MCPSKMGRLPALRGLMPLSPPSNTPSKKVGRLLLDNVNSVPGAKSVVLMSHLGRPDGLPKPDSSLAPIVPILHEKLQRCVQNFRGCATNKTRKYPLKWGSFVKQIFSRNFCRKSHQIMCKNGLTHCLYNFLN